MTAPKNNHHKKAKVYNGNSTTGQTNELRCRHTEAMTYPLSVQYIPSMGQFVRSMLIKMLLVSLWPNFIGFLT